MGGWIGIDLDACLAEYHGWVPGSIGKPVPAMLALVKHLIAQGKEVRIFTARVCIDPTLFSSESLRCANQEFADEQRILIEAWCLEHIGCVLPITAQKDFMLETLFDDRCVTVEMNTGRILSSNYKE